MKYALNQFVMYHGDQFIVHGRHALFTYHNTGTESATIVGSNNASIWSPIRTLAAGEIAVIEHSYKYLSMNGNTTVQVNRGEGNNTNDSGGSGGDGNAQENWQAALNTMNLQGIYPEEL